MPRKALLCIKILKRWAFAGERAKDIKSVLLEAGVFWQILYTLNILKTRMKCNGTVYTNNVVLGKQLSSRMSEEAKHMNDTGLHLLNVAAAINEWR